MKEKIVYLMKAEGLTTTRFAEILETQPSAISHLVSGRNKPSYELLQKILRRFPQVNPDWLLLDSGEPFRIEGVRKEEPISSPSLSQTSASLFDSTHEEPKLPIGKIVENSTKKEQMERFSTSKSPIFVVVFYDDGSCENFSMRK